MYADNYNLLISKIINEEIFCLQASLNPDSPTVGAGISGLLAGVMGARAAKSGKVKGYKLY